MLSNSGAALKAQRRYALNGAMRPTSAARSACARRGRPNWPHKHTQRAPDRIPLKAVGKAALSRSWPILADRKGAIYFLANLLPFWPTKLHFSCHQSDFLLGPAFVGQRLRAHLYDSAFKLGPSRRFARRRELLSRRRPKRWQS